MTPTFPLLRSHARHRAASTLAVVALLCTSACGRKPPPYLPRTRAVTITTVPLLVRESRTLFPFLQQDFAPGGILDGKEVYAFSPSTITVVEGDTIAFTFYNPEDDAHTFVLPDLALALPGQQITHARYVARHAGIFPIVCNISTHAPMMSGQLVVLPAAAMAGADTSGLSLPGGSN
jgi:plastocyanin